VAPAGLTEDIINPRFIKLRLVKIVKREKYALRIKEGELSKEVNFRI